MQATHQLNGGRPLTALADWKVEELVAENIPSETYSSITVDTVYHRFPSTSGEVKARKITLNVSKLNVFVTSILVFFKKMFSIPVKESVNEQLLADHILGNDKEDEDLYLMGEEEVRAAFQQCKSVTLILSDDCNYCQVSTSEAQFYYIAKQAGEIGAYAIKKGVKCIPTIINTGILLYTAGKI
jgi:hypothetical protein